MYVKISEQYQTHKMDHITVTYYIQNKYNVEN